MPKKLTPLSDRTVKALREPGSYSVGGCPGLFLRIRASETPGEICRTWILRVSAGETRVSANGKPFSTRRDYSLGTFEEVTLAQARERGSDIRKQIRAGQAPEVRRRAPALRKIAVTKQTERPTFEKMARELHKIKSDEFKNAKHAAQWINTLQTYAFPTLGGMDPAAITTGDIVAVLRPIWMSKPETASRVRQRIGAVMTYAVACEVRTDNPADMARVKPLLQNQKAVAKKEGRRTHQPRVPVEHMPELWQTLGGMDSLSSKALRFTIATAARTGETIGAKWQEFDLEKRVWTIPGERMKAGLEHRSPLSDEAVAILKSLPQREPGAFVFANPTTGPLSNQAMLELLRGLADKNPAFCDPDQENRRATVHGLRSSFADWTRRSENRYPDEVSELQLAHVNSDATRAAYKRDALMNERAEMMQKWSDYLRT